LAISQIVVAFNGASLYQSVDVFVRVALKGREIVQSNSYPHDVFLLQATPDVLPPTQSYIIRGKERGRCGVKEREIEGDVRPE